MVSKLHIYHTADVCATGVFMVLGGIFSFVKITSTAPKSGTDLYLRLQDILLHCAVFIATGTGTEPDYQIYSTVNAVLRYRWAAHTFKD